MTAGNVESSAAMCSLTVGQQVLDRDALLQYLIKIASSSQLHVKTTKGNHKASLLFHHHTLHQRNAIVRALVTTALHGALDARPHYLVAGQWSGNNNSASLATASLTYWMSVADQVRSTSSSTSSVLDQLTAHLDQYAFLLPTAAAPTVADLDLAIVLLQTKTEATITMSASVSRWLRACANVLQAQGLVVPNVPPAPTTPLVFFDGTQDASAILQQLHNKNKDDNQKQKGGNNQKQQQQQQGKQQQKQPAKQQKQQGKQQGGKKQQQQQQQQAPAAAATYDASALDIRVGQIQKVWPHPEAEKLYCEEIDLGNGEIRQIASGLRPFYTQDGMEKARVLVLANLKKRNLVGFPSHGMVLCASNADHTDVKIVTPPEGAALGDRVQFDGLTGEPEAENKMAKKKVFEKIAPDLKTNADGQVVYKSSLAKVGDAVVVCGSMPNAHVS